MKNKRKKQPSATLHNVNVKISQSKPPCFYWIVALLVGLIVFMLYIPALKNGFVASWDDNAYVYNNQEIRSLDFRLFYWIPSVVIWHPITMISLAIDYAIWGLNPLGYHLTNNLFHAFNTSLVFILTFRLIKLATEDVKQNKMAIISGAVTAILFGLHPLHVESVAWVSERKDVLSAFFFLLSLLAYLEYIHAANLRKHLFYAACILSYILALMSKPMAVSLPIVLLILDFYPLGRLSKESAKNIIIEKLPFVLLSLMASFITIWAHHSIGGLTVAQQVSGYIRTLTAVRGYIFYILKMILPLNLAPLYPLPPKTNPTDIEYLGSAILVVSITVWCIRLRNRNKLYLSIWTYYVATLLPVIGIVQVGDRAAADRFTYLPSLGPFLLVGFGVAYLYERDLKRQHKASITVILVFLAVVMSSKTIAQIAIWKDPITLWSYEISLYPETTYEAYGNRGLAYYNIGEYDRAIKDFDKAIAILPQGPIVYINRGLTYDAMKMHQLAIKDYNKALELDSKDARAYLNRGNVYADLGDYSSAVKDYNMAIDLNPKDADAYYNLGMIYSQSGNVEQAEINYRKAAILGLKDAQDYLNKTGATAYNDRGGANFEAGDYQSAIKNYSKAIELDPRYPDAYFNRGTVYNNLGDYREAIKDFTKAIEINPKDAMTYTNRGNAYNSLNMYREAIKDYSTAVKLNPQDAYAYYNLGVVYSKIGDAEQSVSNYRKAASLGLKEALEYLRGQGVQ